MAFAMFGISVAISKRYAVIMCMTLILTVTIDQI